MAEFLVGVGVAVIGLVPGFLMLVLVARYSLRISSREHGTAEAWRVAATNSTIVARVYENLKQQKDEEDDEGVLHGG